MEADDLLMVINLVEFIISGKRLLDEIALRLARNLYASYKPTHVYCIFMKFYFYKVY